MNSIGIPDQLKFPYEGFLWNGVRTLSYKNGNRIVVVDGPLCKHCAIKLVLNDFKNTGTCPGCKKTYQVDSLFERHELQIGAQAYLEAKYNENVPIISFDLTPTKVIDEDNEDSNYWIQAKIVQKDGKRSALVYIGEKIHGKQSKQDYSQIFIDIDDEQVRFDKGNMNPMKLLTSLVARFPNSTTKISKGNNE